MQPTFRDATTPPHGFPAHDLWGTSAGIPYRCLATTKIWVVLLTDHTAKIFSSTNHKHTVARREKTRPRIQKHFPESKARPRIQKLFTKSETLPRFQKHVQNSKHVQNPKTLLRIQNTSQRPKHFPESKTLRSENPKTLVIIQNTSQKPKTHSRILILPKNTFGFWEVFWIRGRFLDSGKCFGFWNVFLDSGRCFGFWEVFFLFWDELWILGSALSLWDTVTVTRVTVLICIPL